MLFLALQFLRNASNIAGSCFCFRKVAVDQPAEYPLLTATDRSPLSGQCLSSQGKHRMKGKTTHVKLCKFGFKLPVWNNFQMWSTRYFFHNEAPRLTGEDEERDYLYGLEKLLGTKDGHLIKDSACEAAQQDVMVAIGLTARSLVVVMSIIQWPWWSQRYLHHGDTDGGGSCSGASATVVLCLPQILSFQVLPVAICFCCCWISMQVFEAPLQAATSYPYAKPAFQLQFCRSFGSRNLSTLPSSSRSSW